LCKIRGADVALPRNPGIEAVGLNEYHTSLQNLKEKYFGKYDYSDFNYINAYTTNNNNHIILKKEIDK